MSEAANDTPETENVAPEAAPAPAVAEAPATGSAPAPASEARVAELEAEVAKLKDQVLRAMAEVENTRRRAQRDREDASKFAVSSFAKDLLAVSDNLRRALESVPADALEGDEVMKSLAVGVEATERQLLVAFERAGIKRLEPLGQPFDPNFHQVMFEIENTGKGSGTVVQELQAGYVLNGRLLREAMVGVAKGDSAGGGDAPNGQHTDIKA